MLMLPKEPTLEPIEGHEAQAFDAFVDALLARLPKHTAGVIDDLRFLEDDALLRAFRADWRAAQEAQR